MNKQMKGEWERKRERERQEERLERNSDTVDLEAIIIPGCSFVQ